MKKPKFSISTLSPFERFTPERLKQMGLEDSLVEGIKCDRYQGNLINSKGYLGAFVLNYLLRESALDNGNLEKEYVNAYSFSEVIGLDLSDILRITDGERPIVVERMVEEESDLYISIQDIHHAVYVGDGSLSLTELANLYHQTNNDKIKEEVFRGATPLIKYVTDRVKQKIPKYVDREDIEQSAALGLCDALNKFDPSLYLKFETYAILRMKGAILDDLRSLDPLSRRERRQLREMRTFHTDFLKHNQREPTDEESLIEWQRRGFHKDGFHRFYDLRSYRLYSLERETRLDDEHEVTLKDSIEDPNSENHLETIICQEFLSSLESDLEEIPERYREGVRAYLLGGLTEKEFANKLGVSDSRISQVIGGYIKSRKFFKRTRDHLGIKKVINLNLGMSQDRD